MQSSVFSYKKKHLHPDQENSSLSELNTIQLSANKCPNSVAKCQRTQKQMQTRGWAVLFPPLPFIWIDHGLYHHLKSQIFSEAVFVDTPIMVCTTIWNHKYLFDTNNTLSLHSVSSPWQIPANQTIYHEGWKAVLEVERLSGCFERLC